MEVAEDVKKLQRELETKVTKKMGKAAIKEYGVKWEAGGIDPEVHKDHREYLNNFCADIYYGLTDMIETAQKDQRNLIRTSEMYSDYHEVLHHLHFCNMKCETFCGREDVLADVEKYIHDASMRKPLVLYAKSGAGKTSVMAMVMKNLKKWFKGKRYVGAIRFLGTSPYSGNIYNVLFSICSQLADVAGLLMEPVGYKSMKNIVEYIPRFFRRVASTLKCPVVIMLDSLDQLTKVNKAYSAFWLPLALPPNFKIIVSTLPEEHKILDNLRELYRISDSTNKSDDASRYFINLPILPQQTGREIIDTYLLKKKRKVTAYQEKLIMMTFVKSPGPLFLKLILDEAAKWSSYMPEHELVLQDSVRGAINQLFDNLEVKFGKIATSHVLGYITIAMNGISENELEDALSCDDEALNDLYRYHDPPVPGIVRCPPVIVARIHYDIKEYIVERMSQGKYTMNWYHRQFIEAARTRYASGVDGQKLHRNLCEIYMAEKGVKRTITLTRRAITVTDADRQVTPQPVVPKNHRMLLCLPYHIVHAGQQLPEKVAKENCLCNFKYICAMLSAFPAETLIDYLSDYLEKNEDEEIQKLRHYFSIGNPTATLPVSSHGKVAALIMAYIAPEEDNIYLKSLVDQAEKFMLSEKKPALIPAYPCLAPRRDTSSSLLDTFEDVADILSDCSEAVFSAAARRANWGRRGRCAFSV